MSTRAPLVVPRKPLLTRSRRLHARLATSAQLGRRRQVRYSITDWRP